MNEREILQERQGKSVVLGDTYFIAVSFTFYPLSPLKNDGWIQTRIWNSGYVCFNYWANSIDEAVFLARNAIPCVEDKQNKVKSMNLLKKIIFKLKYAISKREFESGALSPVIKDGVVQHWETIASVDVADRQQVAKEFNCKIVILEPSEAWKGLSLNAPASFVKYVARDRLSFMKVEARGVMKQEGGYLNALNSLAKKNGHDSFVSMSVDCKEGVRILKHGLRARVKLKDKMRFNRDTLASD